MGSKITELQDKFPVMSGALSTLSKLVLKCEDILGFVCQFSFNVCTMPCPALGDGLREVCMMVCNMNREKCKNEQLLTCAALPAINDVQKSMGALKKIRANQG